MSSIITFPHTDVEEITTRYPWVDAIIEEGVICGQTLRATEAINYFLSGDDGYDTLVFSQDPIKALKKKSFDELRGYFPDYSQRLLETFLTLYFFAMTKNAEAKIRTLPVAKQKAANTTARKLLALVREGKVEVGDISFQATLLQSIEYLCWLEQKNSNPNTPEPSMFEFSDSEKKVVFSTPIAMFAGRTVNIGKDLTEAKAKEILRLLKGADPQKIIAVYNLAMAK